MKIVKSLLMGSAAGICAAQAVQAADLPMRAAAPVEYVRVCSTHGAGYFYIPGTDTCLRVGGRVRFTAQYLSSRNETSIRGGNRGLVGGDNFGYQSLTFLNFDARTQTGYGMLRTFIRVIAAYNTGGQISSNSNVRFATAYTGTGQDTFGRAQSQIVLDKAFIQFAGFTAGRAASFFDFYAHDLEHYGVTGSSDVGSTNLLAYTATFGGGWSATISVEDPLSRRQPIFTDSVSANGVVSTISGSPNLGQVFGTFTQAVPYAYNAAGVPTRAANYDTAQRELVPDVVAAVRYSAPWGAAQVSAAMHELRPGRLVSTSALTYGGSGLPTIGAPSTDLTLARPVPQKIREEIGWAVQGGIKLNLPQLATGDVLWLQAAYSEGASSYAGHPARMTGRESLSNPYSGRFTVSTVDSYIGADGKQKLTESWSVVGAFLHYWNPQVRSAVFGSYSEVSFGKGARTGGGPAVLIGNGSISAGNTLAFDTRLRDYSIVTAGVNLIWSPVKDLDIGIETNYSRATLASGRTADLTLGSVAQTGILDATGNRTIPGRTAKYDDIWATRIRVQRDF